MNTLLHLKPLHWTNWLWSLDKTKANKKSICISLQINTTMLWLMCKICILYELGILLTGSVEHICFFFFFFCGSADLEKSHHQRVSELRRLRSMYVLLFFNIVTLQITYFGKSWIDLIYTKLYFENCRFGYLSIY